MVSDRSKNVDTTEILTTQTIAAGKAALTSQPPSCVCCFECLTALKTTKCIQVTDFQPYSLTPFALQLTVHTNTADNIPLLSSIYS